MGCPVTLEAMLLLAESEPDPEKALHAYRLGMFLIVMSGITGVLLIVALVAAWRNFNRRLKKLEASRDERGQQLPRSDLWAESAQRMQPVPGPAPSKQENAGHPWSSDEPEDGFGDDFEDDGQEDDDDDDEPPAWK